MAIFKENMNEEIEKEMEEEKEVEETAIVSRVQDFAQMRQRTETKSNIFTNIKDDKRIFNLDTHVDELLNECEGEQIRVKEVLIKRFEKPMKEPIVDEETGEIIKDKEITMSCIIIDDSGRSYATGSKMFTIQMMRYIDTFGISDEGFEIKIVKVKQPKTGNKALQFELV